ncbi:stage II sporulation protein M [Thomasclavelia cocleata]|uniref:stage II sporulation protein M n=1 Tax=Thomasclavelia cocleata TaxID=69824 RepID=UPI0034E505EF
MRLKFREYITFSLIVLILGISFFTLISLLFSGINFPRTDELKNIDYGLGYVQSIMLNNILNFIQYFILFFISPLLIIIDLINTVYQIYISIQIRGVIDTFSLLWAHAIFEIPNMLLYMCLSFKSLRVLLVSKKLHFLIEFWKENKQLYFLSILLIIVASFIEGMVN